MNRTLNQPLQATATYLPGSQKTLTWAPEMIMLFWETLQCNKRFRSFVIDGDQGHRFLILMLFYALEYRVDPAKQGLVRMCVFVLQTLSTEINFGKLSNRKFDGNDSLPATIKIADFEGSYADFMIIVSFSFSVTNTWANLRSQSIRSSRLARVNWMLFTLPFSLQSTTLLPTWNLSLD